MIHIAGPTDDGWIVIAVHDFKESWERFRDDTLLPGLSDLRDEGFTDPPEDTTYEVEVLEQR